MKSELSKFPCEKSEYHLTCFVYCQEFYFSNISRLGVFIQLYYFNFYKVTCIMNSVVGFIACGLMTCASPLYDLCRWVGVKYRGSVSPWNTFCLCLCLSACLSVCLSVSLLYGSFYASCINLHSFIRASYNMYINDAFFIVIIIH